LDERIAALEHQQDQLLSFINFLVENLPDLVINILHTSQESEKLFHPDAAFAEGCVASDKNNCCQGKNIPCPTRREQDVLDLLVKGLCAKEIASRLFISETTVITHKKNLKEKFNARNTVELISKAQAHLQV
jgi:DNA-binding NarL/FixJ family response regulator